jgi:hypothetical protein
MGTRGFITFVADGVEKTSYARFDSYPQSVGKAVLEFLHDTLTPTDDDTEDASPESVHEVLRAELTNAVRGLRLVSENDVVTSEDVERLAPWTNLNEYAKPKPGELPRWCQLTRRSQGDPAQIIACGYVLDDAEFPRDSLFAEWGYVIDMDEGDLEVYVGSQTRPHNVGRFAARGSLKDTPGYEHRTTEYFPCRRIAAWPLDELPTYVEFEAACLRGEELSEAVNGV